MLNEFILFVKVKSIMLPDLSQEEIQRYSRHLLIPEVGMEGQRRLKSASVLLVGIGGLGSPVALYLAAAGVGHIGIVDYDIVEASNLQRQIIHGTERAGRLKVESARQRMLELNPLIQVDAFNEVFTSQNAERIAKGYDILVDGTDNFPTRYLINDLCALTSRPYVYGSVFRFEGQVSVFDSRVGPCYRCLFPEPPPPGSVPSCADGGVFGVMPGIVGTIQAAETIKLILGMKESLVGRLLLIDGQEMRFQEIHLKKAPDCKLCGPQAVIKELVDYEQFCGVPYREHKSTAKADHLITPSALSEKLKAGGPLQLIDVRAPVEQKISTLPGAVLIPIDQLEQHLDRLDHEKPIVCYCRTGVRSGRAVRLLIENGFQNVCSLEGGINAWAQQIDPDMLQY
jgi:adenylyltransferase/sulfurtransferase